MPRTIFTNPEDFFTPSETCTVMHVEEDPHEEARQEQGNDDLIDREALRRAQDWSYLGSQVVGAEVPRN